MEFEGIGIGASDFRNLRMRKNYFVDKSLYIKNVIDSQSKVIIVTRPRRFGKTLNISMLRYFFDCDVKDSKEFFEGLKIMEQGEKYTSKLGAYPCIYLTLKDIRDANYANMILDLKMAILDIYRDHRYLLDSDKIYEDEKEKIMDILYTREDEEALKSSVRELSEYLHRYYGKPVMLFIDEYDVPIQTAYINKYYGQAIEFLKTFFETTLKDNPYLEKAVLTGVNRVAKESIFSGVSNLKVCTMLDDEFANDFGITSEEMNKVIEDFKVEDEKEEIKKWYDGYRVGNVEGIYNPWSVLNYLTDKQLKPYWVNTSSNDLIKLTIKNSMTVKEKMERLLKDEEIEVPINLETVIYGIQQNEDNIWELMIEAGYLRIEKVLEETEKIYKCVVKIPNLETSIALKALIEQSERYGEPVIPSELRKGNDKTSFGIVC